MPSFNKVILMGNLCRDPELRYTQQGTPVCSFDIAVNEVRTDKNTGEKKEEVLFIKISAFGKTAESTAEFLKKGSSALVEGKLKLNQWTSKEGQKRSRIEAVASRVQFLFYNKAKDETTAKDEPEPPEQEAPEEHQPSQGEEEENIPF